MFKDNEKKLKFYLCANIVFASIMGVYAQDITYLIVGDSPSTNSILFWLTIVTVLSIVLFMLTPILIYRTIKKSSFEKRGFIPYIIANYFIGILTSLFSIFVLIMSWG